MYSEQIRGNQVRYFSPAKRRLNPAHRPGFLCAQMDISMEVSMDTLLDISMNISMDIHMDMSMDTHMEMPIKSKV
ncbi:hypothetical protein FYL05_09870, partial [Lactobacillus salivarius]|nr:hypothetical protein [Ligilactobacillus salivarius]